MKFMGCHPNISHNHFPKQGPCLGYRTAVLFYYSEPKLFGTIVRDDYEEPFLTIIKLDDGRFILANECQYLPESPKPLPE